jgi:chorismate mutase
MLQSMEAAVQTKPSLAAVRERLDAIDADLLALLDERAALAAQVAAAKRAEAGGEVRFGLRPEREAAVIRGLLARPRQAASTALVLRLWRELMAESLALQGPFQLTVWGGADPARAVELARRRFGVAPSLGLASRPEPAVAAARAPGGVAVLMLEAGQPWWARLLAEPRLKVFAALPCLAAWGPVGALAVADVEVGPTGGDETFWVTDAPEAAEEIETALGRLGLAGRMISEGRGLKLFALAGYVQPEDERLARAPGRLTGVIGAAPAPFDL